ncbi:hypothetical protein RI367_002988 [Sorochytrium milnesiophthora]
MKTTAAFALALFALVLTMSLGSATALLGHPRFINEPHLREPTHQQQQQRRHQLRHRQAVQAQAKQQQQEQQPKTAHPLYAVSHPLQALSADTTSEHVKASSSELSYTSAVSLVVISFASVALSVLTAMVLKHYGGGYSMAMTQPPPRGSKYNTLWKGDIDYSITSPLAGPAAFPCQGKPKGEAVATYNAGDSIPVSIGGSAVHGRVGDHCEFSIQYPGDSKFAVLKRVVRTCLVDSKDYAVKLPSTMPSCEGCVFSWSWINAIGNREYYMNCADINIKGSTGAAAYTGDEMLVANLAGLGPTVPEFGAPGSDDSHTLFDNRPQVTVGNGAASAPAAADVPAPEPAPTNTQVSIPESSTSTAAVATDLPAAAVPTPTAESTATTTTTPEPTPVDGAGPNGLAEALSSVISLSTVPAAPVPTTTATATADDDDDSETAAGCENTARKCTMQGLLMCRKDRWINTGLWCVFNNQN